MSPLDPEDEPRVVALLQLLRTAEAVWNASRVFFARWELGPSQFNVLNLLRLYPQGLSQTELSRTLVMHRSNLTGLIDHLEERGLAARQDAAGDRRAYRVVLTSSGAALLREILPAYYEGALRVWGDITDRRASALAADLARLAASAESISAESETARSGTVRAGPARTKVRPSAAAESKTGPSAGKSRTRKGRIR